MNFDLFITSFGLALCAFCTRNILTSRKNIFVILHGAFENNKMINLLIGLLNQHPSGWNESGSNSITSGRFTTNRFNLYSIE